MGAHTQINKCNLTFLVNSNLRKILSGSATLLGLQHIIAIKQSIVKKEYPGFVSFANTTGNPMTRENIPDTNNRNDISKKTLNSTYFLQMNHLASFDTLLVVSKLMSSKV